MDWLLVLRFARSRNRYQVQDPRTADLFAQCWDKSTSNWTVLDDVKVWYNECPGQQGESRQATGGWYMESATLIRSLALRVCVCGVTE